MPDDTDPPFPVEPEPTAPTSQTTTSTKTETIETDPGTGPMRRQPGELWGMSGRFWITMIMMIGSTVVVVLVLQSDMENETKALTVGAYVGMAGNIGSTYLGQNAGPSKAKPS